MKSKSEISPAALLFLESLIKPDIDLRHIDTNSVKDYLENEGYIKVTENGVTIRDKTYRLFSTPVDYETMSKNFDELYLLYPHKVGTRKLRSLVKGDQYSDLKTRYLKKVKTTEQHNEVITALKREIATRTASGDMKFFQLLATWINNSSWELWIGDSEGNVNFMEEDL